eukprot:9470098-Pyramimonas_sp.AAC.1
MCRIAERIHASQQRVQDDPRRPHIHCARVVLALMRVRDHFRGNIRRRAHLRVRRRVPPLALGVPKVANLHLRGVSGEQNVLQFQVPVRQPDGVHVS